MLAVAWVLGIRISWVGKHTMFWGPFSPILRALGGIPIDRRIPHGMVTTTVAAFRATDELLVGIPPEGTRNKVAFWKSGFYHIARAAEVPVGLGFMDYARKVGGFGGFIMLTGDYKADMDKIRAFYKDIRGKIPERESPPRLKEET